MSAIMRMRMHSIAFEGCCISSRPAQNRLAGLSTAHSSVVYLSRSNSSTVVNSGGPLWCDPSEQSPSSSVSDFWDFYRCRRIWSKQVAGNVGHNLAMTW